MHDEKQIDGSGLGPFLAISMTGERLVRLHQNPFYVQAYEFFLNESTRLSEILDEMQWSPCCDEQQAAIRLQCHKMNQTRLVLQQLRAYRPGTSFMFRTSMACCDSDPRHWDSWHISWERFVSDVRRPIQSYLETTQLRNKIKYIVPTYGVPSHISKVGPYEGLSVDAFRAAIYSPAADNYGKSDRDGPNSKKLPHRRKLSPQSPRRSGR